MSLTKATTTSRRNARRLLDLNIAKAATTQITRLLRAEGKRVEAATAGKTTPSAWETAARGAISDAAWIQVITSLWLSDAVLSVWMLQQKELGTDYKITPDVRRLLGRYAAEHGRAIAETQRNRLTHMLPIVDRKEVKDFRSTMRGRVSASYAAAPDRAAQIAFTETLQATETVRFESARHTSETDKFRMRKVWFTSGDSLVRPTHAAVNGQSRVVSHRGWGGKPGKFRVGGASLRYPRDPVGPPAEIINCRCFLEYRRVKVKPGRR